MESALKSSSEYEKNLAKRNTSLYKIVYYSLELVTYTVKVYKTLLLEKMKFIRKLFF
jgi:hypothetical protein